MTRRLAVIVAVLTAAAVLAGCGRPGDGGYEVTVRFARAVALYPQSRVKLMGVDVGRVTGIEVDGDGIEVRMSIDTDVPLPADVTAAIVPLSLIGERNVTLAPAWKPGDPRLPADAHIPVERTSIPVEPDEALQAITDLANALDPDALRSLVTNGAAALDGVGADLNEALRQAGDLTRLLAGQDDTLISIAERVHALTETLRTRQEAIGRLIDDFATAADVLASERDAIAELLRALADLSARGQALVTDYRVQLPEDVASLTRTVLTIEANADSVQLLVRSLSAIGTKFVDAYEPTTGGLRVRVNVSPSVAVSLQPIFDLLGLGPVPCLPALGACT